MSFHARKLPYLPLNAVPDLMSPTERTLKELRRFGYLVAVVEKWNPHAKIRQDLFGIGDVLAVSPEAKRTLLLQVTTGQNVRARLKKLQSREYAETIAGLKAAGWHVGVWGWARWMGTWGYKEYYL